MLQYTRYVNSICCFVLFAWSCIIAAQDQDIRLPPTIIDQSEQDVLFIQDETVILMCDAEGYPRPSFTWLFNGTILDINQDGVSFSSPGENGNLDITDAMIHDVGEYVCLATNPSGTAITHTISVRMAINSQEMPSPERIPVVRARVGESVTLKCKGLTSSYPTALFDWQQQDDNIDSQFIENSETVKKGFDDKLYFSHVRKEDAGSYQCFSENTYTSRVRGGLRVSLVVEDATPSPTKPSLAFHSDSLALTYKDNDVELSCVFSGYPTPEITWQKDGEDMAIDYDKYETDIFGSKLYIFFMEEWDEGRYTCVGRNSEGEDSHEFNVRLALYFESEEVHPVDRNVTAGETVTIPCEPTGFPEAEEILWMANGKPITQESQKNGFLTKAEIGFNSLVIPDVCKTCKNGGSDLMVIQCLASNSKTHILAQGYLNVLEPTVIVTPPKDVNLERPALVTFACVAVSDPSTPIEYSWLFNGQELDMNNQDLVISGPLLKIDNSTVNIDELDTWKTNYSYFGSFTCVANNGYSIATATANLTGPATTLLEERIHVNWAIAIGVTIGMLCLLVLLSILIKKLFDTRKRTQDSGNGSDNV